MIHKCPACPMLFYARSNRTYCTTDCNRRAKEQADKILVAELEWIAGTDSWPNVAERLGFNGLGALEKKLYRLGQHEWATRLRENGDMRRAA